MALLLGDFLFEDFEIPDKINGLGGKQTIAKHRLIGGARVADAMGPDEGDPAWSGRFQGDAATDRAQQLNAMRLSGQEFPLSFGSFFYSVLIEEFEFVFERPYQITYQIKLYVVSVILPDAEPSLDGLVSDDLSSFSDLISQFSNAA